MNHYAELIVRKSFTFWFLTGGAVFTQNGVIYKIIKHFFFILNFAFFSLLRITTLNSGPFWFPPLHIYRLMGLNDSLIVGNLSNIRICFSHSVAKLKFRFLFVFFLSLVVLVSIFRSTRWLHGDNHNVPVFHISPINSRFKTERYERPGWILYERSKLVPTSLVRCRRSNELWADSSMRRLVKSKAAWLSLQLQLFVVGMTTERGVLVNDGGERWRVERIKGELFKVYERHKKKTIIYRVLCSSC